MFKAVFVLAVCVFLTVKAQDVVNATTNVLGHDVNEKDIFEIYQRSELSRTLKFEGDFIQFPDKPPCCPYKRELVTNVLLDVGVCHVIFPISQEVYKTVCLCDKCAKHCNNKPGYGCSSKYKIVKLYVCCHDVQLCKIVYINVPTGPCFCTNVIPNIPLKL